MDTVINELNIKLNSFLDNSLVDPAEMKKLVEHYRITGLYNYSFYNSLLIQIQGGTICQSFQNWKILKRYVKKGEKAKIIISIPYLKKIKNNQSEEEIEKLSGFGYRKIFDIKQTAGEALKYTHNSKEDFSYSYESIKSNVSCLINKPIIEDYSGNARGYINNTKIVVSSMSNNIDKIKTLIHEVSHDLLGHVENTDKSPAIKEVEAEAVCGLVLSYLNIDFDLSKAYIGNWRNINIQKEICKIKLIKTAETLIKTIDKQRLLINAA